MKTRTVPPLLKKLARLLLPIGTITLTTVLLFLLRAGLSTTTVALIYLLPVLVNTIYWGLVPGVLTALVAFMAYNYFFLIPYYTFVVHQSQDVVALAIFLVVAILISQLVGQARKNLADSIIREQELTDLYELSLALTGVNQIREIAAVIATQALEAFQAKSVRLEVNPLFGGESSVIEVPSPGFTPTDKPVLVATLETARSIIGEIQIWRENEASLASEERMLRTFASQGALALERASLVESETRAKVLEESDRLKTALLSSVTHELRTPLATIKAAITGLLSEQVSWDNQARVDLLSAVDEETDLLNYLFGNLLDMSRIETGALKPNQQWNLLSEIVEGVVVRMHRKLRGYQVEIKLPDNLPLVPVDYVQMEQVFSNLLSNSAKYAPPGSTIQVLANAITPETLLVEVTNQGPQILPEHLERIFEKFYRLSESDKVSGTGLGLSICKGIIEAHGGHIWAENRSHGIAFIFTLPLIFGGVQPPVIEAESL